MKLYVDHRDSSLPGNPSYEIPGPLLFLQDDAIMRRNEGRTQVFVPMTGLGGETWEDLYVSIEASVYVPVVGDNRLLVYRSLTVIGGGTPQKLAVGRQIDIGVLYGDFAPQEGWAQYPDLKTWWDTLDLAKLDRGLWEAFPQYAGL